MNMYYIYYTVMYRYLFMKQSQADTWWKENVETGNRVKLFHFGMSLLATECGTQRSQDVLERPIRCH